MVFKNFLPRFPKKGGTAALWLALLASCIHKKYETPSRKTPSSRTRCFSIGPYAISNAAVTKSRAFRLTRLMNTYESSEYLAKAKLAVADSWYPRRRRHGMAQAEAEYKDFIFFYPDMEESAEAQSAFAISTTSRWTRPTGIRCRLCGRKPNAARCWFVIRTANLRRRPHRAADIQESLAEHEYVVGIFYWRREMNPAAANRLNALVDQYPLYSKSGEAYMKRAIPIEDGSAVPQAGGRDVLPRGA